MDGSGFTKRARIVIKEIRNARQWGLDPKAFALPVLTGGTHTAEVLAAAETTLSLNVVKYAWHARGGRIDPQALSLWLDHKPKPVNAADVIETLAAAADTQSALLSYHPQNPQFKLLRQAYLKAEEKEAERAKILRDIVPPGRLIRPGDTHDQVAIVRRRVAPNVWADHPEYYDQDLAEAVAQFMIAKGKGRQRVIGRNIRAAINDDLRKTALSKYASPTKILANMERWRHVPAELGDLHIWNNLPEYTTSLVKSGEVIHSERIIIGKKNTQTPIFSDKMSYVVFKPEWGVPSSIKIKSLLPKLRAGDYDALRRKGMAIKINGKKQRPSRYDWFKTDIRAVPIVRESGGGNPLGNMKFMFPNRHAVYMHDTPKRHLFKSTQRTFSHGCIRVRNPGRLAKLVLAETNGWQARQIEQQLWRKAKSNNSIPLNQSVHVHNVYFTVVAKADGSITSLSDIYGHDKRFEAALKGTSSEKIASWDPARKQAEELKKLAKASASFVPGKVTKRKYIRQRPAPRVRSASHKYKKKNYGYASYYYKKPKKPKKRYKSYYQPFGGGPMGVGLFGDY